MKILVNGQEAVLKAGSSFEYVSENPLFTDAEDYSMDIEFPMKDCPQNILIFGALHVKGVDISTVSFPCEIVTESFDKTGILTITEVCDAVVKGQFLEGMSQQNFASSVPNTLITELNFSDYDGSDDTETSYNRVMGQGFANMVVWDKNYDGPIFNREDYVQVGWWTKRHVYLWKLLELVCLKCSLSLDDSALRAIPIYTKVVVVNTVRCQVKDYGYGGFPDLERALPQWTVKEFFNEICKFFGCVCDIDSTSGKVTFKKCSSLMNSSNKISLSVLDNFEVEMSDEETKFRGNIRYKIPDDSDPDKLHMCPWVIGKSYLYWEYSVTSAVFKEKFKAAAWAQSAQIRDLDNGKYLFKLTDLNQYAVVSKKTPIKASGASADDPPQYLFAEYEIINQFGDFREGEELGIAPCPIRLCRSYQYPSDMPDHSTHGYAYKAAVVEVPKDKYISWLNDDDHIPAEDILDVLKDGEEKEVPYYKKLWCVIIDEEENPRGYHINTRKYEADGYDDPQGYVGDLGLEANYSGPVHEYDYTLTPADSGIQASSALPQVDETKLYRYKFLSKTLPDPKAIYVIKGKEYACLRLTAHFTVDGMSDLIEGEFYEIVG